MSSTGRSVQVDGRSLAGSLPGSKNSVGRSFLFRGDENVLKVDGVDGCTALAIIVNTAGLYT